MSYIHLWRFCKKCRRQVWLPAIKRGHYKKDGCPHDDLEEHRSQPAPLGAPWKWPMVSKDLMIELSVKLSDGTFDTSVKLPVGADEQQRNAVVSTWFELIQKALKLAQGSRKEGKTNEQG